MKRLVLLFLASALACFADEVTITKAVLLKGDHAALSLKVGTVVELISTDNEVLTVRYKKVTGTIPASAIADPSTEPETKEKPKTPPRKAETTYGKAVEKAKDNAAKHDKEVVKPTDEILGK